MGDNEVKRGVPVMLKSGGPEMTVKHAGDKGYWLCQWFDGKKLCEGVFHEDSLAVLKMKSDGTLTFAQ